MAIRFNEEDVRETGRQTRGVRAIKLHDDDIVVGMETVDDTATTILTVTERGYGKRTELSEYRLQSRGGSGIINIKTSERNGNVVAIAQVKDTDEIMITTDKGKIIRIQMTGVPIIGRKYPGRAPYGHRQGRNHDRHSPDSREGRGSRGGRRGRGLVSPFTPLNAKRESIKHSCGQRGVGGLRQVMRCFRIMVLSVICVVFIFGCGPKGEEKIFFEAEQALIAGDYVSATEKFTNFVINYPGSEFAAESQYRIGYIHSHHLRDAKSAMDAYAILFRLYPKSSQVALAREDMAAIYSGTGEERKAIGEYAWLMENGPSGKKTFTGIR